MSQDYPSGREIEEALQAQHDERLRHLLAGHVPDYFERAIKSGRFDVEVEPWQTDLLAAYREVVRRRAA